MNPWVALLATGAGCWHAWVVLAGRVPGIDAALPLALVGGALATRWITHRETLQRVPAMPLTILLMAYCAAVLCLPPLLRILPAALAVAYCLHAAVPDARSRRAPPASFFGLVALALPVVDSFEFYFAYPVRLIALQATLALLRMNGLAVDGEGLGLRFAGDLVEFDAPCSGVRMLWTCWFLASAVCHLYRYSFGRYALALLFATLIALASNVLRATSLFYLEAGLLGPEWPRWLHDAVGIAAFCITALALCWSLVTPRARPS
jgi:exosortase/archaeosortase family protein